MPGDTKFNQGRRDILHYGFMGISAFIGQVFFPLNSAAKITLPEQSILEKPAPLNPPDKNGVRLPAGFTSRIVARSGLPVFNYTWHAAPDGGAAFPTQDGGWIYVSNSELDNNKGGVGALKFNAQARLIDAYSILAGTSRNCAGGPTPWGSWLSCEEIPTGQVWECDPMGEKKAVLRGALGRFMHEGVAVDPERQQLYLTEDKADGCLYRFSPDKYPDLEQGVLEVAQIVAGDKIKWHALPDPQASRQPTRYQLTIATKFNGGEGIWYHNDTVYFTTKGDERVWGYDIENNTIEIIYNAGLFISPVLTGVDNITTSSKGDILVAEDGGDMQIVVITKNKTVFPLLQVTGHEQSEITGPAFSPDGTRLYFSSQRGKTGRHKDGITFEITGPFISD